MVRFKARLIVGYGMLGVGLGAVAVAALRLESAMLNLTYGGTEILRCLGLLIAGAPAVALGWTLAAGRKTIVLFLRRFGNERLNDAVRELVQSRLRRGFRLVTLDDTSFAPLGPHWSGILYSLAPAATLLVSMAAWAPSFLELASGETRGEGLFGGQAWLASQLVVQLVGVFVALLFALIAAALGSHVTRRRRIEDARGVHRVVKRLKRLNSWWRAPAIFAPTATVVTVSDQCWQQAVVDIAGICGAILIDISEPRPHICWELRALQREPVVLLAHRGSLEAWWDVPAQAPQADAATDIRALAAGLPLIVYDEPEQIDQTSIVTALAAHAERSVG